MGTSIDRQSLSFSQAEGAEPLPAQLQLRTLSSELTALLWRLVHSELSSATKNSHMGGGSWIEDPWKSILFDFYTFHCHKLADEFKNESNSLNRWIKGIVTSKDYIEVFEFLQYVIRHRQCPFKFSEQIDNILKRSKAPYRVSNKTIYPIGDEADAVAIEAAFANLLSVEFGGARSHLRNAIKELNSGRWADSVRESIHAVESVARSLEPSAKEIQHALEKVSQNARIHPAMKAGFLKLYAYTSDEKGVRHSEVGNDGSPVDEADAMYMLGACSAFVSYMISKSRSSGIIK
jgi:hypothetical protein